ncbi:MAG: hypothetical protein M1820_001838 [Bogoriella megaspora]|nr:MAG: hypothetical protein M1820_001838 [Bogoriella megaspora]
MDKTSTAPRALLTEEQLRDVARDLHIPKSVSADAPAEEAGAMNLSMLIHDILDVSRSPNISSGHRAAATNALCATIEKCQRSPNFSVRALMQTTNLWSLSLDIFLQWTQAAKGKAMRQLLTTLSGFLQTLSAHERDSILDHTLPKLFEIAFRERNGVTARPALQALEHFLSRNLVIIDKFIFLFEKWLLALSGSSDKNLVPSANCERLIFACLEWLSDADKASTAAHLTSVICRKTAAAKQSEMKSTTVNKRPIWSRPVVAIGKRQPETIRPLQSHVFPALFKLSLSDTLSFLELLQFEEHLGLVANASSKLPPVNSLIHGEDDTSLLLAALQSLKEIGLMQESDQRQVQCVQILNGCIRIPDISFSALMSSVSTSKRLAGLTILVSSPSISRSFTSNTLYCLRKNLFSYHVESDSNFRGELLSLTQKLIDRLRAITMTLHRYKIAKQRNRANKLSTNKIPDPEEDDLDAHVYFINWYRKYLTHELRPTAPYQRRICSLKVFLILLRSGIDPTVPNEELSKQARGQINWPLKTQLIDRSLAQLLLSYLLDPYDDIRLTAATILRLSYNAKAATRPGLELGGLCSFLRQAEVTMLRSGRADHADGVARTYALLFSHPDLRGASTYAELADGTYSSHHSRLSVIQNLLNEIEQSIAVARRDLPTAVEKHPIHGSLASLRYVLEQKLTDMAGYGEVTGPDYELIEGLRQRTIDCLSGVWQSTRKILCNDAPEGHIPEDFDEVDLDTKTILSFSWRALKESSLLHRTLVSKTSSGFAISPIHEQNDMLRLGNLCFDQLVELRHRGAFAIVAQTFATSCSKCVNSQDRTVQSYLDAWYTRAIAAINGQGSVITRRSAGIPSLITGILSADPESSRFGTAISDLERITKITMKHSETGEEDLPQVHALNCLKDIFRTAKLGESSEKYIETGFGLVAHSLDSEFWAIRNCGLMLFRALTDRLLGTNESQAPDEPLPSSSSKVSYDQYPKLLDLILTLLRAGRAALRTDRSISTAGGRQKGTAEDVFPVLYILQKALPPKNRISEIEELVIAMTASPQWLVRDMAARTFAALTASHGTDREIPNILQPTYVPRPPFWNQNAVHGILLTVKHLIRSYSYMVSSLSKTRSHWDDFPSSGDSAGQNVLAQILLLLQHRFHDLYVRNSCPITKAAYVDTITSFAQSPMTSTSKAQLMRLLNNLDHNSQTDVAPSSSSLERSILTLQQTIRAHLTEALAARAYDQGESSWLIPSPSLEDQVSTYETSVVSSSSVQQREDALQLLSNTIRSISPDRRRGFLHLSRKLDLRQLGSLVQSPSAEELVLGLYGFYIDIALSTESSSAHEIKGRKYLDAVSYRLQNALEDNKPFSTRFAAATSLSEILYAWNLSLRSGSILQLHMLVQTLLDDDDEEIRMLGVQGVQNIMHAERNRPLEQKTAPVAQRMHCQYLVRSYGNGFNTHLLLAMGKGLVSGTSIQRDVPLVTVQAELDNILNRPTALFDVEDQNLYRDATQTSALHAIVIERLQPASDSIEVQQFMRQLSKWTVNGLRALLATACSQSVVQGPLGWSYQKSAFELAYRVIRATRILLLWRAKYGQGILRGGVLKDLLVKLLKAGREANVHPNLLAAISGTLEEACRWDIRILGRKIESMLGRRLLERMAWVKLAVDIVN